jgi:hypothetical protein
MKPRIDTRAESHAIDRSSIGRFIQPGHIRAFQMITSQLYENITLWSCRINGEPGVAIVLVDDVAPGKLAVMPLFVAITGGMELDFEGAAAGEGDGDEGGGPERPDRSEVLEQFLANAAALQPGGGT